MKIFRLLSALCVLFPALAWSDPVHSVWATSPLFVADPSGWYNATSTHCVFSWNASTGYAFANARATTSSGDVYEFQLVSAADTTTSNQIVGNWNVTKNDVRLCTNCPGSAYGLDGGVGSTFKLYVSGSTYHLGANITNTYSY